MNNDRRKEALNIRISAAKLAANRNHPAHIANGDEQKFRRPKPEKSKKNVPSYLASFTKGMPHNEETGLIENPEDFQNFVKAIDSGDPRDFKDTRLGPEGFNPANPSWRSTIAKRAKVRAWESQGAGSTFDLEGPDSQAVTMPPAPAMESDELVAEMGEVYAQALLRDVPFTEITSGEGTVYRKPKEKLTTVKTILGELSKLKWFKDTDCCDLDDHERSRKRKISNQTAFRGITKGDDIGPYISQFLLAGNAGINSSDKEPGRDRAQGLIAYGALNIDQRVRTATPYVDYMTTWEKWLDVQQGASLGGLESYVNVSAKARRFITTPRDIATYVHYDALYESYLNALLIMMGEGVPFDPDIPFQRSDFDDHQQGFAHFGGPHILSLVTEVATRALKAVRFQKFNVHRRFRPEALAARLYKEKVLCDPSVTSMRKQLNGILKLVASKNGGGGNFLLPMAFAEGSPMHPSYGAGHATVAGACVTILKAFFDHAHPLTIAGDDCTAFVPTDDGQSLTYSAVMGGTLTVEGELNKLASNIAIGRDWAGVHYFTDYIESLRMGEQIALGILEEQKLTYGENFSMTVPLFDGGSVRI